MASASMKQDLYIVVRFDVSGEVHAKSLFFHVPGPLHVTAPDNASIWVS